MTILIADDNPQMRRMLRSLVSDLAETIHECADGEAAVLAYAAIRPDWVLMDVMMEPLDGLAATRQIRSHYPDAKIIIVTNYDDANLQEAAMRAGATEYVVKKSLLEIRRLLAAGTLCR
jgi:CheY-like chemotaxis protein